jgi:hypothetical protein
MLPGVAGRFPIILRPYADARIVVEEGAEP